MRRGREPSDLFQDRVDVLGIDEHDETVGKPAAVEECHRGEEGKKEGLLPLDATLEWHRWPGCGGGGPVLSAQLTDPSAGTSGRPGDEDRPVLWRVLGAERVLSFFHFP